MKALTLALASLLLIQPALQAETIKELNNSPIARVTAYQGQGLVSRMANLNLSSAGDYRLRVTDIPLGIVGDSLNVKSLNSNGIVIQNVQLMPLPAGVENPAIKKLRQRQAELRRELAQLDNVHALNQRSQQWLNSWWNQAAAKPPSSQASDWQKTLDFLSANQGRILESETTTRFQKEALEKQLSELEQQLAEHLTRQQNKTQAAVIYFSAKAAGPVQFQLSYLIPGIQWTPSYDARLDEKAGKLLLTYFGDLTQQTGENWQDTELNLSTATPQINAATPVLEPWIITDQLPLMRKDMMQNAPAPAQRREAYAEAELSTLAEEDDSGGYAGSDIQTQGLSVIFAIPHKVSVESGPHARRVAIASRSFSYEPEYQVVPKLSSRVYLRARFRNNADLPLLTGQIRNYVDQDYTGTSQIPLVRPNEEASLNFGADENIRVTRREGLDQSSLTGLLKDTRRREMSYEIEVSNFKNKPVKLIIWDHLPLIRHDQIHLQILKIQPQPQEQTRSNLLRWELELKPQEKKKISVAYAVEHPVNLEIYSNFSNSVQPRKQMQQYQKF
jgi:uncharacterized protein (TIGR02231 family)